MNTPNPIKSNTGLKTAWHVWAVLTGPIIFLVAFIANSAYHENSENTGDLLFDPALEVSVIYVTARAHGDVSDPNEFYSGERGNINQGVCQIEFEKFKPLRDLSESVPFHIPSDRKTVVEVQEMNPASFRAHLDRSVYSTGEDIVVYIHGYNVGFEKSCRRAATFQHGIDMDHRMILFSWPADGNVLNYAVDEVDLDWSIVHLANFLDQLKAHYPGTKLHLIGHSLGARGLIKALHSMEGSSSKFGHLILLAPDADSGVFAQLFPGIKNQVERVTLYASDSDNALKLSRQVHGYPRLGEAGEYLTVMEGLDTIDISPVGLQTPTGHLYHLYSSEVQGDIKLLLETAAPAESRPGLVQKAHDGIAYWVLEAEEDSNSAQ